MENRDLEAEAAAARTGFGTVGSFAVASRPPHVGLAKHPLRRIPGVACIKAGHCQYQCSKWGTPLPRGRHARWHVCEYCTVVFCCITNKNKATGM